MTYRHASIEDRLQAEVDAERAAHAETKAQLADCTSRRAAEAEAVLRAQQETEAWKASHWNSQVHNGNKAPLGWLIERDAKIYADGVREGAARLVGEEAQASGFPVLLSEWAQRLEDLADRIEACPIAQVGPGGRTAIPVDMRPFYRSFDPRPDPKLAVGDVMHNAASAHEHERTMLRLIIAAQGDLVQAREYILAPWQPSWWRPDEIGARIARGTKR